MPIVSADIKYKLSIKTGSAGNSAAQPDVNASLGKYISTTEITDNTLNNLFDNVSGDENAASDVEYRCIFIHNGHATLTLIDPKVWISDDFAGGTVIAIGIDPAAATVIGSASAQAAEIANEGVAPAGATFSAPVDKASGLSLGDLDAGKCRAVWVRRTAANTAAVNSDGALIKVEGDTGA